MWPINSSDKVDFLCFTSDSFYLLGLVSACSCVQKLDWDVHCSTFYHTQTDRKQPLRRFYTSQGWFLATHKQTPLSPPHFKQLFWLGERRATKMEINEKNSWLIKRSLPASYRWGRGISVSKPQFTYTAEVPGPLERKSLFETHCSLVWYNSGTQTEYVCLCVCICVCKCIPEHSPPKTLQTMSVQVREREREGGRKKQTFDKVLDRKGEKGEGRGHE